MIKNSNVPNCEQNGQNYEYNFQNCDQNIGNNVDNIFKYILTDNLLTLNFGLAFIHDSFFSTDVFFFIKGNYCRSERNL